MAIKFKNNASGTLKTGIAADATSMEVSTGHGDRFPAVADPDYFYATFENSEGTKEIVKVTARTAGENTMTIARAQDGTDAAAWEALDVFEQRITAGVFEDIFEDIITNAASVIAVAGRSSLSRPGFSYSSTSAIKIGAGSYYHIGTVSQRVYWDAELTFTLGSGGSNGSSDNLSAAWHYIYIDDSAVVTQGVAELDADCFINDTTAPTYSHANGGWYNGDDRCIFAVLGNGSSQITKFYHDGGDYLMWDESETNYASVFGVTDWTAQTITQMPGFSTKVCLHVKGSGVGAATTYLRVTGSSAVVGQYTTHVASQGVFDENTVIMFTDSDQKYDLRSHATTSTRIMVNGWFFPKGM